MKNLFLMAVLLLFTGKALAVCTSPISRTNAGTNTVLTSSKYNSDINAVYNHANNLPGDCILDETMNGSKIINATITAAKLGSDSVTTTKIQDGSITKAKLSAGIDSLVPVGAVSIFFGTVAPDGFLLCKGQSLSRTTYAALFAVIGTNSGSVDGNSFSLPDLRGMHLVGINDGRTDGKQHVQAPTLGGYVQGEIKAHSHSVTTQNSANTGTGVGGMTFDSSATLNIANTVLSTESFGQSQNTVNAIGVNYIIKY